MENAVSAHLVDTPGFVPGPCLESDFSGTPPTRELRRDRAYAPSADEAGEWTDQLLVEACVAGDQRAWAMLIGRYKNLIYSFPRRYGAGAADAADVFQLVCAELFRALPRLRSHQSLRAWIMTVASHQSYQWKRRHVQRARREGEDADSVAEIVAIGPVETLERTERERTIREAIAQLPPRCRELVRMLFYADPPVPYDRVAGQLGLAIGSIGLTRARCLKKLEALLEGSGVVENCGCE
jgi:RNA polymerase sigma factor (sigma-70 family)